MNMYVWVRITHSSSLQAKVRVQSQEFVTEDNVYSFVWFTQRLLTGIDHHQKNLRSHLHPELKSHP